MSLFGDDAHEAAFLAATWGHEHDGSDCDDAMADDVRRTLDAAIAALDETELIEKAARVMYDERDGSLSDEQIARAVLVSIGLLPEETRP